MITIVTVVLVGLLAQLAHAHRRAVRRLGSRQEQRPLPLAHSPPVTVIRPVKGVDVEQEANFRAALDTALPFVIRATSYFASLALGVAMLATGHPWIAGLAGLVFVLEGLHYVSLHRRVGGARVPLRLLWMAWMPYLTTIPIGLSMLVRPELDWRGHTYRLDGSARLRTVVPEAEQSTPSSGSVPR